MSQNILAELDLDTSDFDAEEESAARKGPNIEKRRLKLLPWTGPGLWLPKETKTAQAKEGQRNTLWIWKGENADEDSKVTTKEGIVQGVLAEFMCPVTGKDKNGVPNVKRLRPLLAAIKSRDCGSLEELNEVMRTTKFTGLTPEGIMEMIGDEPIWARFGIKEDPYKGYMYYNTTIDGFTNRFSVEALIAEGQPVRMPLPEAAQNFYDGKDTGKTADGGKGATRPNGKTPDANSPEMLAVLGQSN